MLSACEMRDEFFLKNREDRYRGDNRDARHRWRDLPQLGSATLDASAFFVNLRAACRREMEMERQEEYCNEQNDVDPTPFNPAKGRKLDRLHGS